MSYETITVYVTKYALTRGILRMQVRLCGEQFPGMVDAGGMRCYHGEGRDWHRTFGGGLRLEPNRCGLQSETH